MERHITTFVLLFGFLFSSTAQEFTPPSKANRVAAIGGTDYLPANQKAAFADTSAFVPKTKPKGSDWLANHREPGQTFDQFLRTRRNLFRSPRTVIYVQPMGAFSAQERKVLDKVVEYARIFFDAQVKLQKTLFPDALNITSRNNPGTGQKQLLSTDILKVLKQDLPADAYARIAVTMTDLYPDPAWNFVFGQASFTERTGVYSFARYGEPGEQQFLRRCLQIFSHETGHMFAFMHCVHYQCLMNGSNHLGESDKTPLYLCPVCLRKLHAANHFDIDKRYQALHQFFKKNGMHEEADWMKKRIN